MQCYFTSNFVQVENEEKGRTFDKYVKEGFRPCKIQRKEASDAIFNLKADMYMGATLAKFQQFFNQFS